MSISRNTSAEPLLADNGNPLNPSTDVAYTGKNDSISVKDTGYCHGWSAFYLLSDVKNGECPLCGFPERDHRSFQPVI
jgi:hypothetical protein